MPYKCIYLSIRRTPDPANDNLSTDTHCVCLRCYALQSNSTTWCHFHNVHNNHNSMCRQMHMHVFMRSSRKHVHPWPGVEKWKNIAEWSTLPEISLLNDVNGSNLGGSFNIVQPSKAKQQLFLISSSWFEAECWNFLKASWVSWAMLWTQQK